MIQAAKQWFADTFFFHVSQPTTPKKRTVTGTISKDNDALRNAFFEQSDDSNEKRTRLQDRMQSGGA
jgi:hypothetical protein